MPAPKYKYKSVEGIVDFSIDWSAELLPKVDKIISSVWGNVEGLVLSGPTFTDTVTTIFIAGGTDGVTYKVKNVIITEQGRVDSRVFNLKVMDIVCE